jgi:hypothetical protein
LARSSPRPRERYRRCAQRWTPSEITALRVQESMSVPSKWQNMPGAAQRLDVLGAGAGARRSPGYMCHLPHAVCARRTGRDRGGKVPAVQLRLAEVGTMDRRAIMNWVYGLCEPPRGFRRLRQPGRPSPATTVTPRTGTSPSSDKIGHPRIHWHKFGREAW